jgi:hypothetical protein
VATILVQEGGTVPMESKGLQVLWVPQALAETSNTTAGFKFRHPLTRVDLSFAKAANLRGILDQLPAAMRDNGIWVSTTNAFLYTKKENLELKHLVALARARKIYVFQCELGEQPQGWKKVDG